MKSSYDCQRLSGEKVLVTGGNGFVGSHLVESLAREGREVVCLVRPTSDLRWLKGLPIEYRHGCVLQKDTLKEALKGVQVIYHLAGVTKAVDYAGYEKVNHIGTGNLLEVCAEINSGIRKVVIMSSLAASGPAEDGRPRREDDPCRPISHYGKSKRMGEVAALRYRAILPIVIIRPCAVYGPRDRDIYPFFKMFQMGINGLAARGDRYVSLCHISDVVRALQMAASRELPSGEIFFISDGRYHSWADIAETLREVTGVKGIDLNVPDWALLAASCIADVYYRISGRPPLFNRQKVLEMRQPNWTCDITKARRVLGYVPSVELKDGFRQTLEWYLENGWL